MIWALAIFGLVLYGEIAAGIWLVLARLDEIERNLRNVP